MLDVITKNFSAPKTNIKEVLKYAGISNGKKELNAELENELNGVMAECLPKLKYSVCYVNTPVTVLDSVVDFGFASVESKSLSSHLNGCVSAVVFACTIGLEIDRLIYKYGKLSPSKSLLLHALGAERAESLCDCFCDFIKSESNGLTTSRFSAGYGDFPLSFQKEIFALLKPESKISLTLNESLIMSPSKSVTAVIGIGKSEKRQGEKCKFCEKKDCTFRSE